MRALTLSRPMLWRRARIPPRRTVARAVFDANGRTLVTRRSPSSVLSSAGVSTLSRDAALTRRLSGGAGARASSSCSPLVGAARLPLMNRPCRSNRCVGSALADARVFGGRRSWHGIARRRAGRLLGWCGGVALAFPCAYSGGACHRRSSVVRVAVRIVARACACSSLAGARVFGRCRSCRAAQRAAAPAAWWAADTRAPLFGPLVASRPPGDFKNTTNTHTIPLGHPPPVSFELRGPEFFFGFSRAKLLNKCHECDYRLVHNRDSRVVQRNGCVGVCVLGKVKTATESFCRARDEAAAARNAAARSQI